MLLNETLDIIEIFEIYKQFSKIMSMGLWRRCRKTFLSHSSFVPLQTDRKRCLADKMEDADGCPPPKYKLLSGLVCQAQTGVCDISLQLVLRLLELHPGLDLVDRLLAAEGGEQGEGEVQGVARANSRDEVAIDLNIVARMDEVDHLVLDASVARDVLALADTVYLEDDGGATDGSYDTSALVVNLRQFAYGIVFGQIVISRVSARQDEGISVGNIGPGPCRVGLYLNQIAAHDGTVVAESYGDDGDAGSAKYIDGSQSLDKLKSVSK